MAERATAHEAHDIAAALRRTTEAQRTASDPGLSAWVSANAGTGKTYVLTTRILRLLLAGTAPERILALTYTKAAAAEMSKRVFDRLGGWVTSAPEDLDKTLREILGRAPTADERVRARQLFAAAIETPGGLKVQTIHGFCERLLQRFPLEAGIPPHFEILDEAMAEALLRSATDRTLIAATSEPGGRLARALRCAIRFAAEDSFDAVLRDALHHRCWLRDMARLRDSGGGAGGAVEGFYRDIFKLPRNLDMAAADKAMAEVLDDATLKRAVDVLRAGKSTDQEIGACLAAARAATEPSVRAEKLREALLTQKNVPRSDARFITKDIRAAEPALTDALCRARDAFPALLEQRQKLVAVEATDALVALAGAVLDGYQAAKAQRAALDFDDLIAKAASLLGDIGREGGASATQWVLFKLDGGLDHILVDEAQDTSPEQWSVIDQLAREFFADTSGQARLRTLFAVGDEKQSIYGFQGAAPDMFKTMGDQFGGTAAKAGRTLTRVPLDVSFRTTQPVLAAVDKVFEDRQRMAGVSSSDTIIRHIATRAGHAGVVEIWDTEKPEQVADSETWEPNAEQGTSSPVRRLANRIADCVKGWLANGERLASESRPVRASDILILVRRRNPFAPAVVAALKARGVPVAGADRLALVEQIAVQDLMVLGDFLTLPEDDLALATLLKSPLFGLSDDDLMPLAYERKGQLWTALLEAAKTQSRFEEAASVLKKWRSEADFLPPYEFFAQVLDRDNAKMRRRMLARLGAEAADPIDEFLNLALNYDEHHPASLTGFLASLRDTEITIKRDMEQGRDEVRVMTVHGSKGLEAPIVMLPDTCSARSGARPGSLLELRGVKGPMGIGAPYVWPVKGTSASGPIDDARRRLAASELEERNRLLYVALTRPRDRLYITGYEGRTAPGPDCWYRQVSDALGAIAETALCADGREGLRLVSPQTAAPSKASSETHGAQMVAPWPAWATARPKAEPRLVVPLVPSRLAPLESDDAGEPLAVSRVRTDEPGGASPLADRDQRRFLRGTLTHAVLEHLPGLPRATWEAGIARFLEVRGKDLPERMRRGIAREVLAVVTAAEFAPLFGPGSLAEVPIVAELQRPQGKGPPLRLNGQIDRLAVSGHDVLIVDYKTNRPPPQEVTGVAEAYILQLAAYRLALARVFPSHRVRAAILWTDGARLMPIPEALLNSAEGRLWALETLH